MDALKKTCQICGFFLLLVMMNSCVVSAPPSGTAVGPPMSGGPAIDRWTYYYFPEEEVYYSPFAHLYYYPENGAWFSAPVPPGWLHLNYDNYVLVEIEDARPYRRNPEIRRRYPA